MRKITAAALAATMLLSSLAGCSSASSGSTAASTSDTASGTAASTATGEAGGEAATIRFMWWGGQDRADKTNKAMELFMEKNPGIKVETSFFPFDSYAENLSISATSGNMPDVFQGFVGGNNDLMEANLIEPLDSYIESGLLNVSDISESLQESAKIDGKTYGAALGCNVKCLVVDPEAYAKAGLTVPEVAYDSWEALGADLQKLKDSGLQYGADDLFVRGDTFAYFLRQRGETQYSATQAQTINFSKQSYVDYYNMRLDWIDKGLIPPYDVTKESSGPEDSQLAKGNAAVRYLYSSQYAQISEAAQKDLKLILLPGPDTDKATDIRPGCHACMSSQSKNKEAAAKLIDFLINDVDCNKILNAERGMPASAKVLAALESGFDKNQLASAQAVALANAHSSPSDPSPVGDTVEIDNGNNGGLMEDLEQQIIYGQITPEEAYDQIDAAYGPDR